MIRLFLLLTLLLGDVSLAKTLSRSELDFLELNLKKQNRYLKLLMAKGPEAYLEAARLKLSREEKKVFVADLVLIQKRGLAVVYSLDRKAQLVVIKYGTSQTTLQAEHVVNFYLQNTRDRYDYASDSSYQELRKIVSRVSP